MGWRARFVVGLGACVAAQVLGLAQAAEAQRRQATSFVIVVDRDAWREQNEVGARARLAASLAHLVAPEATHHLITYGRGPVAPNAAPVALEVTDVAVLAEDAAVRAYLERAPPASTPNEAHVMYLMTNPGGVGAAMQSSHALQIGRDLGRRGSRDLAHALDVTRSGPDEVDFSGMPTSETRSASSVEEILTACCGVVRDSVCEVRAASADGPVVPHAKARSTLVVDTRAVEDVEHGRVGSIGSFHYAAGNDASFRARETESAFVLAIREPGVEDLEIVVSRIATSRGVVALTFSAGWRIAPSLYGDLVRRLSVEETTAAGLQPMLWIDGARRPVVLSPAGTQELVMRVRPPSRAMHVVELGIESGGDVQYAGVAVVGTLSRSAPATCRVAKWAHVELDNFDGQLVVDQHSICAHAPLWGSANEHLHIAQGNSLVDLRIVDGSPLWPLLPAPLTAVLFVLGMFLSRRPPRAASWVVVLSPGEVREGGDYRTAAPRSAPVKRVEPLWSKLELDLDADGKVTLEAVPGGARIHFRDVERVDVVGPSGSGRVVWGAIVPNASWARIGQHWLWIGTDRDPDPATPPEIVSEAMFVYEPTLARSPMLAIPACVLVGLGAGLFLAFSDAITYESFAINSTFVAVLPMPFVWYAFRRKPKAPAARAMKR